MKIFLGVHKFAANVVVIGDMGWIPTQIRRKMLRYYNRLINLENTRLTKKLFNYEYNNDDRCCRTIRDILQSIGLEHVFYSKSTCDLTECEFKLMEKYNLEWSALAMSKPKLRTFVQFKQDLVTEYYVKLNLDRNHRSMLAQIRFGILPIHIETGQFTNTKAENRLYTIYNSGEVEDEFHFVFRCNFYSDERKQFYSEIEEHLGIHLLSNSAKAKTLFEKVPRKLGKFVSNIFNKRQNSIYKDKI
jgi:hypothetical protein